MVPATVRHTPRDSSSTWTAAISIAAVLLGAAACHGAAPAAPSPIPQGPSASPPPQIAQISIRLTSGWDGRPVADSTVTINGEMHRTNTDGVVDETVSAGLLVEVQVDGFLPRTTPASPDPIGLWPVATAEEADTIHSMLYDWYGDDVPLVHAASPVDIQFDAAIASQVSMSAVRDVWRAAADQITELTDGRIRFVDPGAGAKGHLRITLRSCGNLPICFRQPPYGFGDAVGDRQDFEIALGSAAAAVQPDVALRACVLAAIEFKGGAPNPSPLPGVLSGGSALSDFERRLVRLVSLRRSGNRWPDRDPPR